MLKNKDFHIHLKCDKSTIIKRYRPPFALVCPFHISTARTVFPDKTWDDFVVPILNDWLKCITQKEITEEEGVELWFMEGSNFLHVISKGSGNVNVSLVKVIGHKRVILDKVDMKFADLRQIIYQTAKTLSNAIEESGIEDRDHTNLKKSIYSYEKIMI